MADKALMVAPASSTAAAVKRRRRKVLEEDEYVEVVGRIVERDFYPGLEKLKLQEAYMRARSEGNLSEMNRIKRAYRELQAQRAAGRSGAPAKKGAETRSGRAELATPSFATPIASPVRPSDPFIDKEALRELERGVEMEQEQGQPGECDTTSTPNMTLNAYLATHTSEDTDAYEELAEKQRQEQRERYFWLYDKEGEERQKLLLGGSGDGDTARLESWKYTARNALMYVPEGMENTYQEEAKKTSLAAPSVDYSATRFPARLDAAQLLPTPSPQDTPDSLSGSTPSPATGNTPLGGSKKDRVDLDDLIDAGRAKRAALAARTMGGGKNYSLVSTPSPMPGSGGESPIVTWGEVGSTPLLLDPTDSSIIDAVAGGGGGASKYAVPATPDRDLTARSLAEQAKKKSRRKSRSAAITKLLAKTPNSKASASPYLSQLRASYASPSPVRPSSSRSSRDGATPKRIMTPKGTPSRSSITDNLLNL